MIKEIIVGISLIHGIIHLIGFAKAFHVDGIDQFDEDISKIYGFGWLLACGLFIVSAILLLLENWTWVIGAIGAVIISQSLIHRYWLDAKTGSIINLILIAAILIYFILQ